jgi:hypothetical protein
MKRKHGMQDLEMSPFLTENSDKQSLPYGMWRMEENLAWGWILLVEGEQDCPTLWHHNIPALGIRPGIDWHGDWKISLDGLEVYVMGHAVIDTIHQAPESILDLAIMGYIPGYFDVEAAHLQGQDLFSIINELRIRSIPFTACPEKLQACQIWDLAI